MATAILGNPQLWDDDSILYAPAGAAVTATKGDWLIYSAQVVIPAHDATIGSPAFKVSAAGVALGNSPYYDELGVLRVNTALPFLTHGILRVSAGNSGSAATIPLGAAVYPDTTASGIVGQTGATGVGSTWTTAPRGTISASTGANNVASGVGKVLAHRVGGDSGLGQIDVYFDVRNLSVDYF